jgi:hypothetical protein
MTYGRVRNVADWDPFESAAISHLAELVRGEFLGHKRGPLIRPSGTFSPRGEGILPPASGQPLFPSRRTSGRER